ncbi:hypothetical protein D9M68_832210 [compost metagenome]
MFDGAQALTKVSIPAETWQYDLTGKIGEIQTAIADLGKTKLDKAVLEAVPVGQILVRGPGTTMAGQSAADLVLSTQAMTKDFTAKAGARYWVGAGVAATLPPVKGLAVGASVGFIKALKTQVTIRAGAGQPAITTRAGATPDVVFDIDAEAIFSFNGTSWEI